MVNEIYHAIFERNKRRLCWCIHIATESHFDILKIIASLDSDVHESTKPIIEGSSMLYFNWFQIFSNEMCIHEEGMLKWGIYWKWRFLEFYLIFCFFHPIFLNAIFHVVICLVNTDSIFNFNHVNVEEF